MQKRFAPRYPVVHAVVLACCALATIGRPRRAESAETVTPLKTLSISTTTGEKPQSKLWFHGGHWWAVLASTSVKPTGTWVWRLQSDNSWKAMLRISASTSAKADVIEWGELTHVLLHQSSAEFVSLQYDAGAETYVLWSGRPTTTKLSLSGSETATIDIDTTQRVWLAADSGSKVLVWHSDPPYTAFSGPITLASNTTTDDIAMVVAMPLPLPSRVGVFWSNQATELFGFRTHVDGEPAAAWGADEKPASQSALNVGGGLADDHMNFAAGADGTLYAAVKTSYNSKGRPVIALLVRRPDGTWDDAYQVDTIGTRPSVVVNEALGIVRVFYTSSTSGGPIYYRDSPLAPIAFGARKTALSGTLNNATSTKQIWSDELVVMASGRSALFRQTAVPATTTSTFTTSTTSTSVAGTTTTTSTTIPGTPEPVASVTADVSTVSGSGTSFGTAAKVEVDASPVKQAFLQIVVQGTGGHAIAGAVLRLTVSTTSGSDSDSKGRLHAASCGWTETGLTGTSQPQPVVDPVVVSAPAGEAVPGQAVDFDLGGVITGDGTYCVALESASTNGVDYASREASSGKPVVSVTVVP